MTEVMSKARRAGARRRARSPGISTMKNQKLIRMNEFFSVPYERIRARILMDLSKEVHTLEQRKNEISSELREYQTNAELFDAIRDASEQYKKGLGKIEEKDRITLIRKFIEKVIVEKESLRVMGRVGKS